MMGGIRKENWVCWGAVKKVARPKQNLAERAWGRAVKLFSVSPQLAIQIVSTNSTSVRYPPAVVQPIDAVCRAVIVCISLRVRVLQRHLRQRRNRRW